MVQKPHIRTFEIHLDAILVEDFNAGNIQRTAVRIAFLVQKALERHLYIFHHHLTSAHRGFVVKKHAFAQVENVLCITGPFPAFHKLLLHDHRANFNIRAGLVTKQSIVGKTQRHMGAVTRDPERLPAERIPTADARYAAGLRSVGQSCRQR